MRNKKDKCETCKTWNEQTKDKNCKTCNYYAKMPRINERNI